MSRTGRQKALEWYHVNGNPKNVRCREVYQRPYKPRFIREGAETYLLIAEGVSKIMVRSKEEAILELKRFAGRLSTTHYHRLLTKARKLPLPWFLGRNKTLICTPLTKTKWFI